MTTATAPAVAPFRFFDLTVLRTRRLSPSMRRITLRRPRERRVRSPGAGTRASRSSCRTPARPRPSSRSTRTVSGSPAWRALSPDVRAVMRSYTVRAQRYAEDGSTEIDIDFALHEDGGPACRWAEAAVPGQRLTVLGPTGENNNGVRFQPPQDTDCPC